MKWNDGNPVRFSPWGGVYAKYKRTVENEQKSILISQKGSEMYSSASQPQPEEGMNCTMAIWDSILGEFRWISIKCHVKYPVLQIICTLNYNNWDVYKSALLKYLYFNWKLSRSIFSSIFIEHTGPLVVQ